MIDHTGIDVSDFQASRQFYLAALAPLGYAIRKEIDNACGFGSEDPRGGADPHGDFWIAGGTPSEPRLHIAFRARNPDEVDAFYRAALSAGGRDNGAPGLRPKYHDKYYAAFVYDPDGYNIEAVCHRGLQEKAS